MDEGWIGKKMQPTAPQHRAAARDGMPFKHEPVNAETEKQRAERHGTPRDAHADTHRTPHNPSHSNPRTIGELRVACDTAHWKPASALTCPESTDYGQPTRNGL